MEQQKKKVNLGEGSLGKLLVSLAVPAICAQIINMLYNMVDRVFIGHIEGVGAQALTGVGVSFPIIILISAFALLVGNGGAPRASIMLGKSEKEMAEEILGNSFITLIVLSVLLTIFFLFFNEKILLLFGATEGGTLGYAVDYMNIYTLGTIFVQMSLGLNMFITSQGFAKTSMFTVIIGAILNIILDPIFIFGFGMGVKGAALATIISQGVSAIWVVKFLTSKKSTLKLKKKYFVVKASVILPVMALGLSPFVMQATESILSVCFNTSLLKYGGDLAVGSMTILASVMQLALLPISGLTQGAQPIISFNYGAGNADRVKKTFWLLLRAAFIYSMTIWAVVMIFPQMMASIFSNDSVLVENTAWALRVYMLGVGLMGIQIACQNTFIALGRAKVSIILALLRKVILLIPLIYMIPTFFGEEKKVFAVFLAEPVADFTAVMITFITFIVCFKKIVNNIKETNQLSR